MLRVGSSPNLGVMGGDWRLEMVLELWQASNQCKRTVTTVHKTKTLCRGVEPRFRAIIKHDKRVY